MHLQGYHEGTDAMGLDLSWDGLAAFRDISVVAAERVTAIVSSRAASEPLVCGIDGCNRLFDCQRDLTAHQ